MRGVDLSCVVLNDLHPHAFADTARAAEDAGVRTVFSYDHLSWRDLRDGPWYAAVPLLAAAATATERVRLGTLVASPNYRHPVTFAAEVMTLDQLSDGRVELGVGAGTSAHDASVLGVPALTPRERQDRFAARSHGILDSDRWYQALNLAGACGLAASSAAVQAYPAAALNVVWAVVAVAALARGPKQPKRDGPGD